MARFAVAVVHLQSDDQTWDAAQQRAVAFHPFAQIRSVDRVPARRKKVVENSCGKSPGGIADCVICCFADLHSPGSANQQIAKSTAIPAPAIPWMRCPPQPFPT
ncbi:MAG: hypothetical protein WCC59_08065 [Terriglobales bacterium]